MEHLSVSDGSGLIVETRRVSERRSVARYGRVSDGRHSTHADPSAADSGQTSFAAQAVSNDELAELRQLLA